jgi:hypothetical protein
MLRKRRTNTRQKVSGRTLWRTPRGAHYTVSNGRKRYLNPDIVRGFLTRLHERLVRGGRCFTSGAFVVEVPQASSKFQLFMEKLRKKSTRRFGVTHDDFQHASKIEARRLCSVVGKCHALRSFGSGPQMEYHLSPAMDHMCGEGISAPKRVVLWYPFEVERKKFLYMKLESAPALSLTHAGGAISRYVIKKQKTGLPARRENAYKDKGGADAESLYRRSREASADNAEMWPAFAESAARYDEELRIGMEMLIPAGAVVEFL